MTALNERRALGYAIVAVLLWSTVATGFKLGLAHLAVEQLLLLGSLISWLVFLGYAAATGCWRIERKDGLLTVALGLINPFAYYLILFAAYDRLPAHLAQPINYTWAIVLAVLAVPMLGQALSMRRFLGILIAYGGVVILLVTTPAQDNGHWDWLGIGLALASTLLWAVYWILMTKCSSPPAAVMFWSFTGGIPAVVLVCWLGPGFPLLDTKAWVFGAWVGLVEMGVTFILWQQALRLTRDVARISSLIFASPVISLGLIHWVLGEAISPWALVALAVIILGLHFTRPPNQLPSSA